jgi:phage shock protein A
MTKNPQKIREQVNEMEQAADIALAAIRAEPGVGEALATSVTRLHDWARQAKEALGQNGDNQVEVRSLVAAAEEAADQALQEVKNDAGAGKATRAAIQEAHDAAQKAKKMF